ncbi:MAG: class I SAM-dependent methyltransferase [Anaerolineaceae bacterium]|nr:MAG: class I SAM-dependent methyltransferase [Anaerolineaceae bacterium]
MNMGSAEIQGELWGQSPQDWSQIQEPMHRPLWEAMLDASLVKSGIRILDAGCGGGGASVLAAERGALVSGLDATTGMIRIARNRVPNGNFRVGDIERLPYEDNVFDTVFAANSIQYSADRVATLREFGRVCKPGGRIVAGLFGPPEKVAFSTIFTAVRGTLLEPSAGAGPFELSLPGKLESLFTEAGLNVLQGGEVDCPFQYPEFETFWQAQNSGGPFQRALQAAGKEKLKSVLGKAIEAYRLDDGTFHIQPNIFKYVVAEL